MQGWVTEDDGISQSTTVSLVTQNMGGRTNRHSPFRQKIPCVVNDRSARVILNIRQVSEVGDSSENEIR